MFPISDTGDLCTCERYSSSTSPWCLHQLVSFLHRLLCRKAGVGDQIKPNTKPDFLEHTVPVSLPKSPAMPLTRFRFEVSESESEVKANTKAKAQAVKAITPSDEDTSDEEASNASAVSLLARKPHQRVSRGARTSTGRSVRSGPPRSLHPSRKGFTRQEERPLIKAIREQFGLIFWALVVVMAIFAYWGGFARRDEGGWKPRLERDRFQPALDSQFVDFKSSIVKANATYHAMAKPDLAKAQILSSLAQDAELNAKYLGNLHRALLDIYSSRHPALRRPFDCDQLLPALGKVFNLLTTLDAQAGIMLGNLTNFDMSHNAAGVQAMRNSFLGLDYSGDILTVENATTSLIQYLSKQRRSGAKGNFELTVQGVGECCRVEDPGSPSSPNDALADPDGCIESRLQDFDKYVQKLYIQV